MVAVLTIAASLQTTPAVVSSCMVDVSKLPPFRKRKDARGPTIHRAVLKVYD
jgi:hypothetical protein